MGYARILGGGEDGRYTIELDYGSATKAATLAGLTELLAKIDTGIAEQQALNAIADAVEAEQRAKVLEAQQQVIGQTVGGLPPGSPKPDTTLYKFELLKLSKLQQKHAPMRLNLQALLFDRQQALKQVAKWNAFSPTETRQAWCADLTEDAPAGSYAATLEIPGESSLVLLAPGCRAWSAGDGVLTAREVMSPEQAFLNAALLPGWQKFLPTYRWGTATAVNREANTMNVALAPAISSAQSLSVNQASSLENVPVTYLGCGAGAFEVGDRVVVKFEGQNWGSPRVIGFLDNPKPCDWVCVAEYLFVSSTPSLYTAIVNGPIVAQRKINGGDWFTLSFVPQNSIPGVQASYGFDDKWDNGDPNFGPEDPGAGGVAYLGIFIDPHLNIGVVNLIVGPSFPLPPAERTPERNTVEFRIILAGETVFNAAVQDTGWPTRPYSGKAKSPSGINTALFPSLSPASRRDVTPLDYELTG